MQTRVFRPAKKSRPSCRAITQYRSAAQSGSSLNHRHICKNWPTAISGSLAFFYFDRNFRYLHDGLSSWGVARKARYEQSPFDEYGRMIKCPGSSTTLGNVGPVVIMALWVSYGAYAGSSRCIIFPRRGSLNAVPRVTSGASSLRGLTKPLFVIHNAAGLNGISCT